MQVPRGLRTKRRSLMARKRLHVPVGQGTLTNISGTASYMTAGVIR